MPVADRVSDDVGAVEVPVRRISDRPVRIDRDTAIGRSCRCDSKRIAVKIAVIGEQCDSDGCFFTRRSCVDNRDGWIVDRADGDGDRCCRCAAIAIPDCISDGIAAVEILVRGIINAAVSADHDSAVPSTCRRYGQRIAVWIAVVGEDIDIDGEIFGCCRAIVHRDGRRIGDGPIECAAHLAAIAVGRGDRDGINAPCAAL